MDPDKAKDECPSGKPDKRIAALVAAALVGIILPASWRVAKKAGYPPPLSLLMLVSPANLFLLYALAFQEWPVERELRLARQQNEKQ